MKSVEVMKCKLVKESTVEYEPIRRVEDALSILKSFGVNDAADEVFCIICLDVKLRPIGLHEVSHGELAGSPVHPREVFKRALLNNAAAILLAHNHPSNTAEPSKEDIDITKRIYECGEILGVKVIEHIIVTPSGNYYSFKEHGDL